MDLDIDIDIDDDDDDDDDVDDSTETIAKTCDPKRSQKLYPHHRVPEDIEW